MKYHLNSSTRTRILAALGKLEGEWTVEVQPHRKRRSDSQNRRYFKLVTMAAEVVGCSKEELHDQLLGAYWGWREVNIGPRRFRVPAERSKMKDTKAFADYSTWCEEKIIQYCGVWLGD